MWYFYLWVYGVIVCYSKCWKIDRWIITWFYLILLHQFVEFFKFKFSIIQIPISKKFVASKSVYLYADMDALSRCSHIRIRIRILPPSWVSIILQFEILNRDWHQNQSPPMSPILSHLKPFLSLSSPKPRTLLHSRNQKLIFLNSCSLSTSTQLTLFTTQC